MGQNSLKEFFELLDRLGQGYTVLNNRVLALQERMRPAMENFLEAARQIGDGLSIYLVLSTITFSRGGWSEIPLRDMKLSTSMILVEKLWDQPDEEVKRELDVAVPAHFRRDNYAPLSELVASWRLRFEDRHPIFEDALWAHMHGRYTLSIPTLAAQVEGIVRDLVGDYDEGAKWRRRFLDSLGHDRNRPPVPSTVDDLPEFMALPAHERFKTVEEVRRFFTLIRVQELFDKKQFSDPQSSSVVNRNVILHGVFKSYGEAESLKLFFVLDLVHEAIGMYAEK